MLRGVEGKMEREVMGSLRDLTSFEMPKKIGLIEEDFSIERGELTPTLKVKRRAVEDRDHLVVFVVGHAEQPVERLGHAFTGSSDATNDSRSARPSDEPVISSMARSGCGIRPATLPARFVMPAIASVEPFGLASPSTSPAGWQ